MYERTDLYKKFSSKMILLSILTGIFISITMPITYFLLNRNEQTKEASYYSQDISREIVRTIKVNPELWKFSVVKYTQIFDEQHNNGIVRIRIFDSEGRILDDENFFHSHILTCTGTSDIVYDNIRFGHVEVTHIIDDTLVMTLFLFVVFSVLGFIIGLALFRFPAKIIVTAEGDINNNIRRLNKLSYYDPLTSLRNRAYVNEIFPTLIAEKTGFAIFFLDLDNFKYINDFYGHSVGDLLLIEVSTQLKANVRQKDIVARFGGDEFMIILMDVYSKKVLSKTAQLLIDSFKQTIKIHEHELFVTASIGAVLYPQDGEDMRQLIKNADIAMYTSKANGKNRFSFYSNELNKEAIEMLTIKNSLRYAIERDELLLYFQPKFNLSTLELSGCEILLRWQHPERGMVSPSIFIPIAEESGLILSIGDWVIKRSFQQIKEWTNIYNLNSLRFSINISALQFDQENLISFILASLHEIKLDPKYIELEITESFAIQQEDKLYQKLLQLKKAGIEISIDDFGTGYSSLSYLNRYPIDTLKIALPFIRDMLNDKQNEAIVSTIITMAHNFNMKVIAEGIETEDQLELLRQKKCDFGQGFFFSKPLPAKRVYSIRCNSCIK